jgi:two-component system chemotaxis response regulator CheB
MTQRDIIVIGASAGGVEALRQLVGGLPSTIRASIFVVLHLPASEKSRLPEILAAAGRLPAAHAKDEEPIRPGRIYVAKPNLHMLLKHDRVKLWAGPKENYSRPAIDPLFRTAAETCGSRVIGVVLTGLLDDGSGGLIDIKKHGGIAVVQDPDDAPFSSMPENALKRDHVDYCVRVSEMPGLLAALVSGARIETSKEEIPMPDEAYSHTDLTCPECRGPLSERSDGGLMEFRCRVGHVYSLESAIAAHSDTEERTLWSGVVALEESASLLRKAAAHVRPDKAERMIARADSALEKARVIREMLEDLLARADTEPQKD